MIDEAALKRKQRAPCQKGRYWIGTLNNPKDAPEETLERLHNLSKAVYTVGQLEKGTEGTVHLQFTVTLST